MPLWVDWLGIGRSAGDFPKHIERSELILLAAAPPPESRAERTIHLLRFGNSFRETLYKLLGLFRLHARSSHIVPEGQPESSPAFERRVEIAKPFVPEGRLKNARPSTVPAGTKRCTPQTRRSNAGLLSMRPCGTRTRSEYGAFYQKTMQLVLGDLANPLADVGRHGGEIRRDHGLGGGRRRSVQLARLEEGEVFPDPRFGAVGANQGGIAPGV